MGINSQSQALMDKIRAKKGIPLFLNTVARVREANIRQYCTDPPLVEIGKTQDVFVPARGECSELSFTTLKNSCSRTVHCFLWLFFTTVEGGL